MARPIKKGLDYSPQDVDIHSDKKIRRLLTEFGATGYLVYDYVKCMCFKENGYWTGYDEDFCFDVADVLKSGTTENSVKEILKGCFRMDLFNSNVFRAFRIITSSGIQKRYLEAKRGGKVDEKYLCVNDLLVIAAEIPFKSDLSTQSKVKESKVEDRKEIFKKAIQEFFGKYDEQMLLSFYRYWGEAHKSGKLKWELEETWELKLRLAKWASNDIKFNK